jgi:hypothetical protein
MVYLDTLVCEWHWNQLMLSDDVSVAVFHMPYPYQRDFQNRIDQALSQYKKIIILCSELHDDSADFITKNQHEAIGYFVCGKVENVHSYPWMDWFITTVDAYKKTPIELDPYTVKPKYFDALLGWAKPHRQIIYDRFKNDHRVTLSYLQDRSKSLIDSGWISADNCTIPSDTRNTISKINYHGREISLSQILPNTVYNQTAYSIVAETNYSNNYSFYTEKIVKPILAERLFVVFSGQYYLKNLQQLGFKTFEGIIDESYDSIADSHRRISSALDQVDYLMSQPQEKILSQVKSITEYNKNLMLNTNWLSQTHANIKNSIVDCSNC